VETLYANLITMWVCGMFIAAGIGVNVLAEEDEDSEDLSVFQGLGYKAFTLLFFAALGWIMVGFHLGAIYSQLRGKNVN